MTEPPPDDGGCVPWQAWAPPLDPPTAGGLPADQAGCIADAMAGCDPHEIAAVQWEAYAAMLPPTPAVSSVQTGAQSVSYSPAGPSGSYGLAIARAQWHRSFLTGVLVSVPLQVAPVGNPVPLVDWWQRNLEDPP